MRRWWMLLSVIVVGALAGTAIAGIPEDGDGFQIRPSATTSPD